MKIREQRGLLLESLETAVEIEPTKEAIAKHWSKVWGVPVEAEDILVEYYGYDGRIMEHLYIVKSEFGVFGVCDEEVKG